MVENKANTPNISTDNEKSLLIEPPQKKSRKRLIKILAYLAVFLVVVTLIFSNKVINSSNNSSFSFLKKVPIIQQINNLAESYDRKLKGEEQNRINILLLGVGGKNHSGGTLTDTIMVASIEPSTKKVALMSIPRDMVVPIENMGWRKVNSVNAYAEKQNPGSGGLATSQAISRVLDIPIDYYVMVDFQGFMNIIDKIGGIEVQVENQLDDYAYPVLGNEDAYPYSSRYEHLHVEPGLQTMDGSLALKFARSRHGVGGEGSDFARAKRQQLIIEAAKTKMLSTDTLFNPKTLYDVFTELNEHIATNLQTWEIIKLWSQYKDVDRNSIINKVLDNSANGLLVSDRGEDGAYILTPRSGDFSEIQYLSKNIFGDAPADIKDIVSKSGVTLQIFNGTWVNGLASKKAQDLEQLGYKVIRVGNASRQNFEKSVIYDLTVNDEKAAILAMLKEKTGANVALGLPDWLVEDIKKSTKDETNPVQPDFILILGSDADKTKSGSMNTAE